jgi:hypothetical protein
VKAFYFARLATAGGAIALAYITPALAADNLPIRIGWLSSLTGPLSSAAIAENQGVGLQSTKSTVPRHQWALARASRPRYGG